ncbi:MAG: hypothetical protein A2X78_03290 [Gammaproteobacteria bacterium GWE2_37_16]|nr:MAG: hypothetical protein A2X78_03290 [Gammaproteobacteria bacterium GWE2_37_16]
MNTKTKIQNSKFPVVFCSLFLTAFFYYQNCFAILNLPPPPNITDPSKVISEPDMKRLALVIAYVKQYYVKKTEEKVLIDNAVAGMIAKLDPHSEYLDETDMRDLEMVTEGQFGGVGIELIPDQGAIRVVTPLDDTPAAKAGIKAGDLIIQINDKFVKDMTLRDALNMMRGPKGSKLTLMIARKNNVKPLTFKLTRDIVKVKTVKGKLLESGYGYVRIAIFQDPTARDVAKAIAQLKKKGPLKGLILDLRNNPGGLLDSAVQISDDFLDADKLKDNKLIVYTQGQFEGAHIVANATPGETISGVPMVVLINEGSASAAEIVAGALQDHRRAVIVGTRSFGKGSVQTLLPLDDKTGIKLTTALYYTPSGRSIQAKGIEPDVVVKDLQLSKDKNEAGLRIDESKLLDHLDNADVNKDNDSDFDENDEDQKLDADRQTEKSMNLARGDYQLYEALNILKGLSSFPK